MERQIQKENVREQQEEEISRICFKEWAKENMVGL